MSDKDMKPYKTEGRRPSPDYRNCVNRIDGRKVDGDIGWMTNCRLRKTETKLHELLAKVEGEIEARKGTGGGGLA